jgi:predicted nucleotidyltransferase component of viral defense system
MAKQPTNLGASVRARLLTRAREQNQPFELILTRFALERLLYRLGISSHVDRFILKGAMLLTTWFDDPMRPTRDLDLLGFGNPDADAILAVFREILCIRVEDGAVFDTDNIRIEAIRAAVAYGGFRLRTTADVGGARVPVAIDIAFGDALEPGVEPVTYPVLLDQPAPQLRGYARETVIAEKFQAIVMLGRANSRMKDFYDIWLMSRTFAFDGDRLARAIKATFARRNTAIPDALPDGLSGDFGSDPGKIAQWEAFRRDLASDPGPLPDVCTALAAFLMPQAAAARAL